MNKVEPQEGGMIIKVNGDSHMMMIQPCKGTYSV